MGRGWRVGKRRKRVEGRIEKEERELREEKREGERRK